VTRKALLHSYNLKALFLAKIKQNRARTRIVIAIEELKRYKSPGTDKIPAELIQTGGNTLHSEIHKLINYTWNKEELLQHCVQYPIDKYECSY
jgi:hypothetical protein